MKHLPNFLTLCNLFCGCIAIAFIASSQPYLIEMGEYPYWITGTEQAYWGAIFIGLAAFFDVLDGAAARALKLHSAIGADLDSLADVVSFGVAPSMILYKMLWASNIAQPNAMEVSMWSMAPAFLVACFGAIRLARFNVYSSSKSGFKGMPIPAIGILIASFPLINYYVPTIGTYFKYNWIIYLIIALSCWLMVSNFHFFKLMPTQKGIKHNWARIILVLATIGLFPLLSFATIPAALILYILLSFFVKEPQIEISESNITA